MSSSIRTAYTLSGLLLTLSLCTVLAARLLGASGKLDRGVIAFVRECNGVTTGLYQLDITHHIEHLFTNRHHEFHNLSFSPNGSWLAFDASNSGGFYQWRAISVIDLNSYEEFRLVPGYTVFNGTPIIWHSENKLELWMSATPTNSATQQLGVQSVIVDVARREVIDVLPLSEAIPAESLTNTLADSDDSPDGHRIRGRFRDEVFDLYVQYEGTGEEIRVTHDTCMERYPRWRPI